MQIIVARNGQQHIGQCEIEDRVVMVGRGDHWRPGVIVSGVDIMLDEIVGCAINEGRLLFNEYGKYEDGSPWQFWVSQASSEELERLDLLSARPPKGAVIRTEDGYCFTVSDEGIGPDDGDIIYSSLSELDVDFELTCDIPQFQQLSLAEFRAAGVPVTKDKDWCDANGVEADSAEVMWYPGGCFITVESNGYSLIIGRDEWQSNNLSSLESILYQNWYLPEIVGARPSLAALALSHGWSEVETQHARDNRDTKYDNETVIRLANGREIRTPAAPEPASYVRIVQAGHELAYWTSDEWKEDSECVMGAILGCAHGRG